MEEGEAEAAGQTGGSGAEMTGVVLVEMELDVRLIALRLGICPLPAVEVRYSRSQHAGTGVRGVGAEGEGSGGLYYTSTLRIHPYKEQVKNGSVLLEQEQGQQQQQGQRPGYRGEDCSLGCILVLPASSDEDEGEGIGYKDTISIGGIGGVSRNKASKQHQQLRSPLLNYI